MARSRKPRRRRPARSPYDDMGAMALYIRQMVRTDAAEARGDAFGALDRMEEMPFGPDGEPFWRPWRATRLFQLVMFRDQLPGWVTSRWILEQALQTLDRTRAADVDEALRVAFEARGEDAAAAGKDERVLVVDHDWVYRQVLLYERGGLQHFLWKTAAPDLVAGADRIREWARAPMGGFRYVARTPSVVTWEDLATGERIDVANIGSSLLLLPGECVIGRLVPIEGGRMFETLPLAVSEPVALAVADDPAGWVRALREADEPVGHGLHVDHRFSVVTDVHPVARLYTLYEDPPVDAAPSQLAREVLAIAHAELGLREVAGDDPLAPDVWPCLAAAILEPGLFTALAADPRPGDAAVLSALADVLAEPAAAVCRHLAADLRDAA